MALSSLCANGFRVPNRYFDAFITKRSPSSSRTADSEASKNDRSKPSCTSISNTANAMPALVRTRRFLSAMRLRHASGTRGDTYRLSARMVISEDLGRVGAAQIGNREEGGGS